MFTEGSFSILDAGRLDQDHLENFLGATKQQGGNVDYPKSLFSLVNEKCETKSCESDVNELHARFSNLRY